MITIIIMLGIYTLSIILCYRYFKIAHSKGGIWQNQDIELGEIVFTLIPVINTIVGIMFWCIDHPLNNRKRSYNKFFNIKK